MNGTISPLPVTIPDPEPAPEQSQPCEFPEYRLIIMDGRQLLYVTAEEIFYHLTTYPLTQSLEESMDCYLINFMNG